MNHPDLAGAHMAMRSEEARSFRNARSRQREARARGARPAGARRLSRFGRRPAHAPVAS
jgi:hypothetical protein